MRADLNASLLSLLLLIYRAIPERSLFQVVQITPHDYRSRG